MSGEVWTASSQPGCPDSCPSPLPAPVPSSEPALSRVCVPTGTKKSFLCPDLIETLSPAAFGKHTDKLPGYVCLSVMLPAKPSCLWETLRFSLTNLTCTNFSSAVSMLMADEESAKHPPEQSYNCCACGGRPSFFHVYVVWSLFPGGSPASWQ